VKLVLSISAEFSVNSVEAAVPRAAWVLTSTLPFPCRDELGPSARLSPAARASTNPRANIVRIRLPFIAYLLRI
jgi:hypothetical protein